MREVVAVSELRAQSRKAMRLRVGSGPLEFRLGRVELELLAIGGADDLPAPWRAERNRWWDQPQAVTEADAVEELEQLAEDLRTLDEPVVTWQPSPNRSASNAGLTRDRERRDRCGRGHT